VNRNFEHRRGKSFVDDLIWFRTTFIHEDSAQASPPDLRHGGLAIPNQENFYFTVNYARKMYAEFENTTFGMFGTTFKNNSMQFVL
jgi:hypothetical protein